MQTDGELISRLSLFFCVHSSVNPCNTLNPLVRLFSRLNTNINKTYEKKETRKNVRQENDSQNETYETYDEEREMLINQQELILR